MLRTWIELNIPKIEDGNNFGVEIQEEIVAELGGMQSYGDKQFGGMAIYHLAR